MPEKLSHEADPKHVPDVVYVSPMEFKPNRVAIGLVVGAIVLAIGIGGAYFITNFVLTDATPVPSVEIKKATSSAKPATTSAQKAETADWKTYTNKELGFSIKYPSNWFYNDAAKYERDNCEPGPGIDDSTVIFDRKDLKCVGIATGTPGAFGFGISVRDQVFDPLEQLSPKIQKYDYIVVDGEKAAKTYKTPTSEGPWCSCTRIYFNHSGRGYQIGFVNKDLQGNYDSIYDNILSTFKFLD